MNKKYWLIILLTLMAGTSIQAQKSGKIIRTLIVDGQNNHDQWPKLTYMMKQYLEGTGKFSVEVQRSKYTWKGDEYIRNTR